MPIPVIPKTAADTGIYNANAVFLCFSFTHVGERIFSREVAVPVHEYTQQEWDK